MMPSLLKRELDDHTYKFMHNTVRVAPRYDQPNKEEVAHNLSQTNETKSFVHSSRDIIIVFTTPSGS